MSYSILEAQYQPVEAISHREYRRRLFAKGLKEQGAKASAKEKFGKNKGLLGSSQCEDDLCEAFGGASVWKSLLSDAIFKDHIRDNLEGENGDPPPIVSSFLDSGAESIGDSWRLKLEISMKEEDKGDKRIQPRFEAPWLEELDEFFRQSLLDKNGEQSSMRFMVCPPRSESSRMQLDNEGSVMGMEEKRKERLKVDEVPSLEQECEPFLLFDGNEEDEQVSQRIGAWLSRSTSPERMQVENERSVMGMEEEKKEHPQVDEVPSLEEEDEPFFLFDGTEEDEQGSSTCCLPRPELSRSMELENEVSAMEGVEEEEEDTEWMTPWEYRHEWNCMWSRNFGSFEDTTRVPSRRFTKKPPLEYWACTMSALQIFSVKLAAIRGGLQLPLDVFGTVAVRDTIDHNRNIIFCRTRDNCQTLTEEDPYLVLTGPTRAVILTTSCPVVIQVELKVKGTTESEDKDLSHLVAHVPCSDTLYSRLLKPDFSTKLSTLEFTLGHIVSSVEATIFVQVIQGSWPDGLRGKFGAFTTSHNAKPGINQKKIMLLDSGGEGVTYSGDGKIKLSRSVVSVKITGSLRISVEAWKGDNMVAKRMRSFKASEYGSKRHKYKMGFCELLVTVAWSLVSDKPVLRCHPVETL